MEKRSIVMAFGIVAAVAVVGSFAQSKSTTPTPVGPVIVLETVKGNIEIELFPDDAPKSVDHVLALVRRDFYRGLRFHWVQPGVIQVGDPATRNMTQQSAWGKGGSGRSIGVAEVSKRPFDRGMVGLQYFFGDPKAADSQIFITKQPSPGLDGKYAMIGHVTKGMDVVDKIEFADVVRRVSVKGDAPK